MISCEGATIKKSWIVFASLRLLFDGASMPFIGLISNKIVNEFRLFLED